MIRNKGICVMQKNKHRDITIEIRREILSGKLKPGERLPTRVELEKKFNVSRVTMQNAIDSLVKNGTVYADGTNGTFVSEFPMEIYHYGIIFPHKHSSAQPWSRMWKIILQETQNLFAKPPYSLSVFYGDKYHVAANGNADFIEDIRHKRTAGLIFILDPEYLEGTEIVKDPGIPRVVLHPKPGSRYASVGWDSKGLLGEMAKYLLERKRSKTAVLMFSRQFGNPGDLDRVLGELNKHGLQTAKNMLYGIDIAYPESVVNITSLMMRDKDCRPDSIIILDDNLIEGVIRGIKESGMCVPSDVELVAMVNFPYNERLDVPVKMFGFDISEQLRIAKLKLEAIRQENKYEKTTVLKFISDREYEKAGKAGKSDQ